MATRRNTGYDNITSVDEVYQSRETKKRLRDEAILKSLDELPSPSELAKSIFEPKAPSIFEGAAPLQRETPLKPQTSIATKKETTPTFEPPKKNLFDRIISPINLLNIPGQILGGIVDPKTTILGNISNTLQASNPFNDTRNLEGEGFVSPIAKGLIRRFKGEGNVGFDYETYDAMPSNLKQDYLTQAKEDIIDKKYKAEVDKFMQGKTGSALQYQKELANIRKAIVEPTAQETEAKARELFGAYKGQPSSDYVSPFTNLDVLASTVLSPTIVPKAGKIIKGAAKGISEGTSKIAEKIRPTRPVEEVVESPLRNIVAEPTQTNIKPNVPLLTSGERLMVSEPPINLPPIGITPKTQQGTFVAKPRIVNEPIEQTVNKVSVFKEKPSTTPTAPIKGTKPWENIDIDKEKLNFHINRKINEEAQKLALEKTDNKILTAKNDLGELKSELEKAREQTQFKEVLADIVGKLQKDKAFNNKIIKDYKDDLTNQAKAKYFETTVFNKEPWQLTKEEFNYRFDDMYRGQNHKQVIEEAIKNNKKVPEDVLNEYPDFKQQTVTKEPIYLKPTYTQTSKIEKGTIQKVVPRTKGTTILNSKVIEKFKQIEQAKKPILQNKNLYEVPEAYKREFPFREYKGKTPEPVTQPIKEKPQVQRPIKPKTTTRIEDIVPESVRQKTKKMTNESLKNNVARYNKLTPDELPKDAEELRKVVSEMQEAKDRMISINLGLFGEAQARLRNVSDEAERLIQSAREKISWTEPTKKFNFKESYRTAKKEFVNRFSEVERIEKKIAGKVLPAEQSASKQMRMASGVALRTDDIIADEFEPILKAVQSKGYTPDELVEYATAVHARDVNKAGMKSGLDDAEIDAIIQKYGVPELEAARKQLVNYSDNLVKKLVDEEIISKEAYNAMRSKWKNYIPLNRSFEDLDFESVASGFSSLVKGASNPIKSLKGSSKKIINPLESILKNTYKVENAVHQNIIAKRLEDLSALDTEGAYFRKLAPDEKTTKENIISVFRNGEKVKYSVHPEIYNAVEGMNKQNTGALIHIMDVLSKPASTLRAGATLTGEFILRNPFRDVITAYISKGFNPFTDFARGLASVVKKDEMFKQFIRDKAGFGNIMSMDRRTNEKTLREMYDKTTKEKVVNIISMKPFLQFLRMLSDTTESATKVGYYKKLLREGVSREEAAFQARDLMDFARAGTSIKEANKVIAFLNANIQGKSKIIRSIKEDPVGVTTRLVSTMVFPTVGIYAYNHLFANDEQKKKLRDLHDYQRNSFWYAAIPGTDELARIPKPFDYSFVANSTERFLQYFADKDKTAFDGFAKQTFKDQSFPVMITGLIPLIEGMTNRSLFKDAPIIPKREEQLPSSLQYDTQTSELAKQIATIMRIGVGETAGTTLGNFGSPRVVENTILGFTGGLGRYGMDFYDYVGGKVGAFDKVKPEKPLSQLPIVRGFTANPFGTGKSIEFVYNQKDKLTKERNEAKLVKKKFEKEGEYKYINKVSEKISNISKEIRTITNNNALTAKEKKDKILELNKKRNDLAITAKDKLKNK